jgi:TorA maturation chaperone TorD
MQAVATPVTLHRTLAAEETARADFYALLGRLFQAAPDAALLRLLATASPMPAEGDPGLGKAWQDLVNASSVMDAEAALDEYESLFGGVGKSAVSLYAGFYAGAAAIDHPRVRIRADLAGLGLAPRDASSEPEDHFGAIFDAMRVLVAGGLGRGPATLQEQRRFFESHLQPALGGFLAALARAREANYYRRVAALAAAFLAIETESFQLEA